MITEIKPALQQSPNCRRISHFNPGHFFQPRHALPRSRSRHTTVQDQPAPRGLLPPKRHQRDQRQVMENPICPVRRQRNPDCSTTSSKSPPTATVQSTAMNTRTFVESASSHTITDHKLPNNCRAGGITSSCSNHRVRSPIHSVRLPAGIDQGSAHTACIPFTAEPHLPSRQQNQTKLLRRLFITPQGDLRKQRERKNKKTGRKTSPPPSERITCFSFRLSIR